MTEAASGAIRTALTTAQIEPVCALSRLFDDFVREGRNLLAVLTEERRALASAALDGTDVLAERKVRLLQRLAELEQARRQQVVQVASLLGLHPDTTTVNDIAERLLADDGTALTRKAEDMRDIVRRIQLENEILAVVVARALQFLHDALTIAYAPTAATPLYSLSGTAPGEAGCGQFVRRRG